MRILLKVTWHGARLEMTKVQRFKLLINNYSVNVST